MTPPDPLTPSDPTLLLLELFEGHGIAATRSGEDIHFPGRSMRAKAAVVGQMARAGGVTIQLDVQLSLGPGHLLVESFGGIGTSVETALADAFRSFMASAFHVLLAEFFEGDPAQVTLAEWDSGEQPWRVTLGNLVSRSPAHLEGELAAACVEKLAAILQAYSLPDGTHWVRLYYAQMRQQPLTCEVLLDNDVWDAGQSHMSTFPWPQAEDFYSVRLFLLLQRGTDLHGVLPFFYQEPDCPDDVLLERLCAHGTPPRLAQKLVSLVPLAFGRVLLQQLQVRFAETALVMELDEQDQPREIRLQDEPLFAQAHWLADRAYRQGSLTREQFAAVALRSAEVNAVNQALQAGSEPADLLLAPPILFWGEA